MTGEGLQAEHEGAAAVVVDGLVKRYGGTTVVDGLSFRARAGAVTAVLGPNGAGKTTTIACCEGLRRPDGGRVRVLGLDPAADATALRPRVGVMLQDGGLPTGVGALEFLRHVAALHASPLPVPALVEALGLASFAGTRIRRLSGGQRQRLAVACALVGRPEVVFLDEPSAGLDPQARLAVWEVVARARSAGVCVVLTTHLMEEAERLADHVVIVDDGRVVAQGSPEQLTRTESSLSFSAPAGLTTTSLQRALPPGTHVQEVSAGRYLLTGVSAGPQVAATVASWCAAHDVMPEGLGAGRRTLEDVFLDLTGRSLR